MSEHATSRHAGTSPMEFGPVAAVRKATSYWWLALIAGIAWITISLVILQFDSASITTIGVLVGIMFMLACVETISIASMAEGAMRWVAASFAFLFFVAGIICFVNPEATFVGLADTMGFLFLIVGTWWIVQAFMEQDINSLWWVGLIAGIMMTVLAFWTAGQFFVEKAYMLLVFAGIWALMEGIIDIVRAFKIREVHEAVEK